ncbi:MAG: hypothetical protein ABIJ21_02045 [Nanoarchaeota archaeon]
MHKDEVPKLMEWIGLYWKKGHVLSYDRKLFDFQHRYADGYNFYVARNRETHNFDAILGFISTAQYDTSLGDERDVWLALWKVNELEAKEKILGLRLMQLLMKKEHPNSIGVIGISEVARNIYSLLSFACGKMSQYYYVNKKLKKYHLISGDFARQATIETDAAELRKIERIESHSNLIHKYHPKKTIAYLVNRYASHPSYKYFFYGVFVHDMIRSILVMRKSEYESASCLRIVDCLGELLPVSLMKEWDRLLENENAEFIDFLNFGIDETIFLKMGFMKRDDSVIIPNYFEPFEKRNVELFFAYKSTRPYVFFKGDGDQDRSSETSRGNR